MKIYVRPTQVNPKVLKGIDDAAAKLGIDVDYIPFDTARCQLPDHDCEGCLSMDCPEGMNDIDLYFERVPLDNNTINEASMEAYNEVN
jgi:hypothetical protein